MISQSWGADDKKANRIEWKKSSWCYTDPGLPLLAYPLYDDTGFTLLRCLNVAKLLSQGRSFTSVRVIPTSVKGSIVAWRAHWCLNNWTLPFCVGGTCKEAISWSAQRQGVCPPCIFVNSLSCIFVLPLTIVVYETIAMSAGTECTEIQIFLQSLHLVDFWDQQYIGWQAFTQPSKSVSSR